LECQQEASIQATQSEKCQKLVSESSDVWERCPNRLIGPL
jgi:hypothetical protein